MKYPMHVRQLFKLMAGNQKLAIMIIFGLILAIIVIGTWSAPTHRYADSSTYFLQIASFAEDGDIRYSEQDFNRISDYKFDDLPAGMELIKNDQGEYYYGKEYTYALFTSPFFKVGGKNAVLVVNGFLFFLMIVMGYFFLRQENDASVSVIFSVLFFSLSTAIVYIFWITIEIYSMFILMAGLFTLYFAYKIDKFYLFALSGIFFGIATIARPWNLFFIIPFLIFGTYQKRWNHTLILFLSFLVTILLIVSTFYSLTGSLSFYGGDRYYESLNGPYPFGQTINGDKISEEKISTFNATVSNLGKSFVTMENILYVFVGYFIGRFTGIFVYYPFTLFSIISVFFLIVKLSWRNREDYKSSNTYFKILIVLGIIFSVLFIFLIRYTGNYFGGIHSVGNRYFTIYPAFLFLIGKIDLKKAIPFAIIAFIIVGPVISKPVEVSQDPAISAVEFPYSLLPIEYPMLHALPLWNNTYYFPGFRLIELSREKKTNPTCITTNDQTQFLISSLQPISNITFLVYSESPNYMTFSTPERTFGFTFEPFELSPVTLEMVPAYEDSFFVYPFKVSTLTTATIVPDAVDNKSLDTINFINWYTPEKWDETNVETRWMSKDAFVVIRGNEFDRALGSFELRSFIEPRDILLYINGKLFGKEKIYPGFSRFELPLNGNMSVIRFSVLDNPIRPIDLPELNNNDTRPISIAIRNVSLHPSLTLEEGNPLNQGASDNPEMNLAYHKIIAIPGCGHAPENNALYFIGWYPSEDWGDGHETRWMGKSGQLAIIRKESLPINVSFELMSFFQARNVQMFLDETMFTEEKIDSRFSRYEIPIRGTVSVIRFSSLDDPMRPIDLPQMKNSDTRAISIAIRNITLHSPDNVPVFFEELTPEFQDRNHTVIFTRDNNCNVSYFLGWYPPEEWDNGVKTRWMNKSSDLIIVRNESLPVFLAFQLLSFHKPRNLRIYVDGIFREEETIDTCFQLYTLNLDRDLSFISFEMIDDSERPVDIPEFKSEDTRNLSIAIRNIFLFQYDSYEMAKNS